MRVGRIFVLFLFGTVLSLTQILFGCGRTSRHARHTTFELSSVSVSCGSTDRRQSYSFFITRRDGTVLFSADFSDANGDEIKLNSQRLEPAAWRLIADIIDATDSINYIEMHKASRRAHAVADGDVYAFCLTFSDGCSYTAPVRCEKIEKAMRDIALDIASDGNEGRRASRPIQLK